MGHWILLKGPEGERRVAEGTPYRLLRGESIIGTEQDNSPAQYSNTDPAAALIQEIEDELGTAGKGKGDWVKWFLKPAALLLGKQNCMRCEARKVVENATSKLIEKHGRPEAKRLIWDLRVRSLTEEPEAILVRLKELL